ncbi:hypothetical protein ACFQE1_17590, partial [Halobium palmae]
ADVARLVHAADGRSLRVLPIPMVLARIGLTLGGVVPGFPMGPDQYRSLRFDNTVADNDVAAFGVDPADLRSFPAYLGVEDVENVESVDSGIDPIRSSGSGGSEGSGEPDGTDASSSSETATPR